MITGDEQYRGAGGSSSGSPPASLLVVPQPLTVKPSHPSHLNSHLGGPHSHPPRKYQCKMCPQVSLFSRCLHQCHVFIFKNINLYLLFHAIVLIHLIYVERFVYRIFNELS